MTTARASRRSHRTYVAKLGCGTTLTYEAASFLPDVGEVVPCRRHGFCAVDSRDEGDGRGAGDAHRVTRRRSQGELVAFLETRPVTSIHTLRQHRFTLRVVAAAQKEGLLHLDLIAGRVFLGGHGPGSQPVVDGSQEGSAARAR
jgi:hypothetical protein